MDKDILEAEGKDAIDPQYIETKFELKSVEADGTFTGYAGAFGNIDSHRDILVKGCVTNSILQTNGIIPILADHWQDEQIGWNAEMTQDDYGILVKGVLNLEVQKAKEKYALAKQALDLGAKCIGLSIGYYTKKYTWDEDKEIRYLHEIDLKEYSFVPFPSNTSANVTAMKSIVSRTGLNKFGIKDSPKALEELLREVGFSVSVSKKVATTAMALSKKDANHLREVDHSEVKDTLAVLQLMNAKSGLIQAD